MDENIHMLKEAIAKSFSVAYPKIHRISKLLSNSKFQVGETFPVWRYNKDYVTSSDQFISLDEYLSVIYIGDSTLTSITTKYNAQSGIADIVEFKDNSFSELIIETANWIDNNLNLELSDSVKLLEVPSHRAKFIWLKEVNNNNEWLYLTSSPDNKIIFEKNKPYPLMQFLEIVQNSKIVTGGVIE